MAKIQNISGDDRIVPGLFGRIVYDGQIVDVPAEDVHSYTCQPTIWAPADNKEEVPV